MATEEIRVGDNDNLSALVANLIDADLLELLTDQAGLYTADPEREPGAQLVEDVSEPEIPAALWQAAGGSASGLGTGGMITKLQAVDLARRSGTVVVIASSSEQNVPTRLVDGEKLGAPDITPQWWLCHLWIPVVEVEAVGRRGQAVCSAKLLQSVPSGPSSRSLGAEASPRPGALRQCPTRRLWQQRRCGFRPRPPRPTLGIPFEAPPRKRLRAEVDAFLAWWAAPPAGLDGLVRAGIAHLWFVTIHPFEDGNGRLARAITDMALAQDEDRAMRAFSLSSQLLRERDAYYAMLEETQRGGLDVTSWLAWFLRQVEAAAQSSEATLARVLAKARFWLRHQGTDLSDRQRKVLNRLLDAGPAGFEGGITTRKYAGLTHTSRVTACRIGQIIPTFGISRSIRM